MCLYEFDEEKYMKIKQDEAYKTGHKAGLEQGRKQGLEQGRNETIIKAVESTMQNFGLSLEESCKGLEIEVKDYQNAKVLQETPIS